MIDSTEWDSSGATAVRRRPTQALDDGIEAEWYASAEESFDTAPVVLASHGIRQATLIASMLAAALLTASVVCFVFKPGGHAAAAPAVASPAVAPPAVAAPIPPAAVSIEPLRPAPAPVAEHRPKPKPVRIVKSAKRHKVGASAGWAGGFAQ